MATASGFRRVCLAAAITLLALPGRASAEEVVVFAAASLKNALDAFADDWQRETGNEVTVSYAGSGLLAKQIIEGAPADIFISAAENWMDEVARSDLIRDRDRKDLLRNKLVLIAHGKTAEIISISPQTDLSLLLDGGKLAMALVDSVPAGQYGKAALTSLGLWDSVAPSVAQSDNVRAALALVSAGEAPYGIVYATDAIADGNVSVAGVFPQDSYPPIIYPAALLSGAKDKADRAFFDALYGEMAAKAFETQGFQLVN